MGNAYQIQDQDRPYYLTFQVVGWADIFSRKLYRDIILDSLKYCRKSKGLNLFAYVIMTNHMHVIMQSRVGDLSGLVRDFKKFTSKAILKEVNENKQESRREWLEMVFRYHAKYNKRANEMQLWTHENHAVELSTNDMIDSRLEYIHENPVRAGWVENAEDYLYSSARNYAGLPTLIDIDLI
jgi:REP element-mobilizing transposase RayT